MLIGGPNTILFLKQCHCTMYISSIVRISFFFSWCACFSMGQRESGADTAEEHKYAKIFGAFAKWKECTTFIDITYILHSLFTLILRYGLCMCGANTFRSRFFFVTFLLPHRMEHLIFTITLCTVYFFVSHFGFVPSVFRHTAHLQFFDRIPYWNRFTITQKSNCGTNATKFNCKRLRRSCWFFRFV